jgi:hypothetical protein
MRLNLGLNLALACLLTAPAASASVGLLAIGSLSGSSAGANADLSGLTGPLENGLPGNTLGGMGSGLAYLSGNRFLALPDRGPNATPYNSAVDDTSSYIARFHTVSMAFSHNGKGAALPLSLTPTLKKTTLLASTTALTYGTGAGLGNKIDGVTPIGSGAPAQNATGLHYFTGRSDNFGAGNSGAAANARLDPEGIRVSNDRKSVFVSDEYGPYVRQFDLKSGKLIKTFSLPTNLDVANLSPNGATEISGNTSGRVANKGMEGLAITPDGKTLVGIMQAPLIQDAAIKASKKLLRIVTIDIATGTTHEYGYTLTTGSGVSEIVALNDHQFLLDERDGNGLGAGNDAVVKQIFKIDIAGATDITSLTGAAAAAAAVSKPATPFLDLVAALNAHGITSANIPSKIEGLSLGQDVKVNGEVLHTLWVANDNDFVPKDAGDNKFFVFGFKDSDLPGLAPQQFAASAPEPAAWAMMLIGVGCIGALTRRRRRVGAPA